MEKGVVEREGSLSAGEIELINRHTRRPLDENEVYAFSVVLCDNDIDRDNERFSDEALEKMAVLFVGKTGICDHSARSENQKARVFSCRAENVDGEYTTDGRPYKRLFARAYMLRTEKNADFIAEIEAGIKKEVSVGCSVAKRLCSVCGADRNEGCKHKSGVEYKTKRGTQLCHTVLDEPYDAYEWSFVAVPAQRRAGVTKAYEKKEEFVLDRNGIVKSLKEGTDINLSGGQAKILYDYIVELRGLSELGKNYIAEKRAAVAKCCAEFAEGINDEVLGSVIEKMTAAELCEVYRVLKKREQPNVQLAPDRQNFENRNNGFMIK